MSSTPAAEDGGRSRGRLLERFGSTAGRVIGIVALVGIGAALVNLAWSGRTLSAALVAAVAVLVAVLCWMVLVRPGVTAYERVLVVRNIASYWEVPWHAIDGAEARQTLRIYTGGDMLHAVGVAKSTRQMLVDTGAIRRRAGFHSAMGGPSVFSPASPGQPSEPSSQDYVAERVMALAAQQREASTARPSARRRWALPELALLAVSIVVVVAVAVAA